MVARALGGCGIHNAMLYVRALEEDFKVAQPITPSLPMLV